REAAGGEQQGHDGGAGQAPETEDEHRPGPTVPVVQALHGRVRIPLTASHEGTSRRSVPLLPSGTSPRGGRLGPCARPDGNGNVRVRRPPTSRRWAWC